MATVTVRRKPTYAELEAKVKELQDALVIAEKNKCLRDIGWDMLHNQIETLERQNRSLSVDLTYSRNLTEELNEQITADAAEITELKADRQIALDEVDRLRARLAEKEKANETATKAAMEMAEMLVKANTERDEARSEAEDLKLEVQERDFRIDELEKQTEWLRDKNEEWAKVAADQKDTITNYEVVIAELQKDVKFWKKAADENAEGWKHSEAELSKMTQEKDKLRQAVDEISEQSADFCAKAQYEEERAEALDAANQKLYAQVLGQRDAMDHLQRQLKANEESYMDLWDKYLPLERACKEIVEVFQK